MTQRGKRSALRWRRMMVVALLTLTLALALAACGGRGAARNASNASYSNSQQTQGASNSGGDNLDLQSADQQIQSVLQGLDSAQNDANTDYSSQDTEAQP